MMLDSKEQIKELYIAQKNTFYIFNKVCESKFLPKLREMQNYIFNKYYDECILINKNKRIIAFTKIIMII